MGIKFILRNAYPFLLKKDIIKYAYRVKTGDGTEMCLMIFFSPKVVLKGIVQGRKRNDATQKCKP
jgi:hypothetical protein